MAIGDKSVSLDGLKAVYQVLDGEISGLQDVVDASALVSTKAVPFVWEEGSFNSNGDDRQTAGFIRTANRTPVPAGTVDYTFILGPYTGTIGYLGIWDADGVWTGDRPVVYKSVHTLTLPEGGSFRLTIGPSSNSSDVLDPLDGNTIFQMSYVDTIDVGAMQEAVADLNDAIEDLSKQQGIIEPVPVNWQTGDVSATGTNSASSSTTVMRTATPWVVPSFSPVYYEVPEGYYLRVYIRDSNATKKSDVTSLTGKGSFEMAEGDRFRLTMKRVDGGDISIPTASALLQLYCISPFSSKIEALTDIVNRNTLASYMNFSIFEKFGVIGDSFASGSLHHPDDGGWTVEEDELQ